MQYKTRSWRRLIRIILHTNKSQHLWEKKSILQTELHNPRFELINQSKTDNSFSNGYHKMICEKTIEIIRIS